MNKAINICTFIFETFINMHKVCFYTFMNISTEYFYKGTGEAILTATNGILTLIGVAIIDISLGYFCISAISRIKRKIK